MALKVTWSLSPRVLTVLPELVKERPQLSLFSILGPRKGRQERTRMSWNLRLSLSALPLASDFFKVCCLIFLNKACKCCHLLHDILIFNTNNGFNNLASKKVILPLEALASSLISIMRWERD